MARGIGNAFHNLDNTNTQYYLKHYILDVPSLIG